MRFGELAWNSPAYGVTVLMRLSLPGRTWTMRIELLSQNSDGASVTIVPLIRWPGLSTEIVKETVKVWVVSPEAAGTRHATRAREAMTIFDRVAFPMPSS